jgi:hypothetical protein
VGAATTRCLVAITCCLFASGCISYRLYEKMASGVAKRNQRRYDAAVARLRAQGYRFSDDDVFYTELPPDMEYRCERQLLPFLRPPDFEPIEPTERMTLEVRLETQPTPTPMDVAMLDACRYFAGRTDRLQANRPDGSATFLFRLTDELRPARAANGELVLVVVSTRVVSRQHVFVDMTCDHMPRISGDIFEPFPRVTIAPAPPRRINMVVPEEVLAVKCTHNTS